jgi:hypothetical protein
MSNKPQFASGYPSNQAELVRQTCLYIATKLGDLMDDLVIIGGLVPSLLIDQNNLPPEITAHIGTMDLDIGLQIALLKEERYKSLSERLRGAGFVPDTNENGQQTRQRWILQGSKITIDFLIQPTLPEDKGGKLRNLEADFAAIIAPGLQTAFVDREKITIKGHTIFQEETEREIWVCGAGAYIVLKALAFDSRGENKDAYDLYYVLRNFGNGIEEIVAKIHTIATDPDTTEALRILKRDFSSPNALGPRRVALFLTGGIDEHIQADVVGFVGLLLNQL